MADGSSIEWLAWPGTKPATWNPVVGCTRVNEGCRNCYAERMARRLVNNPATPQYAGTIDGHGRWNGVVNLVPEALEKPLRWREPRTIFVDSMSDLFHPSVPFEYIDRVFAVMALAQQHRFIVLTKRGERMAEYGTGLDRERLGGAALGLFGDEAQCHVMNIINGWSFPKAANPDPGPLDGSVPKWPLPNVILGVSVVGQPSADEQIPHLLETPAACRAVSYEPALGPVEFEKWLQEEHGLTRTDTDGKNIPLDPPSKGEFASPRIDWLICGGESGPQARPMHPDWARSARDQCVSAGVAFFFKQWGEWSPGEAEGRGSRTYTDTHGQGYVRVGKHRAGALLDGREWREFPGEEHGRDAHAPCGDGGC